MYDFVLFIIIIYNILQVDSTSIYIYILYIYIYSYTNLKSIIGFLFIIQSEPNPRPQLYRGFCCKFVKHVNSYLRTSDHNRFKFGEGVR